MWNSFSSAEGSKLGLSRNVHYTSIPSVSSFAGRPPKWEAPAKWDASTDTQSHTADRFKAWEAPTKSLSADRILDLRMPTARAHSIEYAPPHEPPHLRSMPNIMGQGLQVPHVPIFGYDVNRSYDCTRQQMSKSQENVLGYKPGPDYVAGSRPGYGSSLPPPSPPQFWGKAVPQDRKADNYHTFVAVSPTSFCANVKPKNHKIEKPCKEAKDHRHMTNATEPKVKYAIKSVSTNDLPYTAQRVVNSVYPTIVDKKYSAPVLDPRNPSLYVYEYPIGEHWVIWNYCTGMVHLTGLWRAAIQEGIYGFDSLAMPGASRQQGVAVEYGDFSKHQMLRVLIKPNAKADIAKLMESTPRNLQPYIKRVRGGFLKIQGTWIAYSLCKILAAKFAYYIRYHLVPVFGADFPGMCLPPSDPSFGELEFNSDISQIAMETPSRPSITMSPAHLAMSPALITTSPEACSWPSVASLQPSSNACIEPALSSSGECTEPALSSSNACTEPALPSNACIEPALPQKSPAANAEMPGAETPHAPLSPLNPAFNSALPRKVGAGCEYLAGRQASQITLNTPEVMKVASLLC